MDGDRSRLEEVLPRALGVLRLPRTPNPEAERHATWLELFFDLVFVLALSAVTGRLDGNTSPNWTQIGASLGIYALVTWGWVGQAYYDTRYDPDDIQHRLLVLIAAGGAAIIAIGADNVPAGIELPAGYLVLHGTLLVMYVRVLISDRSSREVVYVYFSGFIVGWLLWFASLWSPIPIRPLLWITALGIELCTPWLGRRWLIRHPVHRSHLPERIGQFVIILLGATLVNVIDAVPSGHHVTPALLGAGLAVIVPIGIWWIYTTFLISRLALSRLASGLAYGYLHVPVGAGILFAGWALGRVVHLAAVGAGQVPASLRHVLAASLVAYMLGGLGLQWFALGWLPLRRIALSAGGILPIAAAGAFVSNPILLLGLIAAIIVNYAVMITAEIRRLRPQAESP